MFVKLYQPVAALSLVALLGLAPGLATAAPPPQAGACQDYTVQSEDWLSKLADKFLGDVLAYPAIVEATNTAHQADASYASVANANVIEVGWKLCVPAEGLMMAGDEAMMAGEETMAGEEMMAGEETMAGDEMMAGEETMAGDEMMAGEEMMAGHTAFTVRIENVADSLPEGLVRTPLAPGVWLVHTSPDPLFTAGQPDRGLGLEALAEDGAPSSLAQSITGLEGVFSNGVFNTPVGAALPTAAGPATPGASFEFSFQAVPGEALSFATMFGESNDLFFGPGGSGIALFNADGSPVSGDVTGQVQLWDTGTEVNQEPGAGPDQAPRQAAPNTGPAENGPVQVVDDGFTYPAVDQVIRVTISPQ